MSDIISSSDSYLTSVYDYFLDLVRSLVTNPNNGYYDEMAECYYFDYRLLDNKKVYSDDSRTVKLPFNDINDYFKIQNYKNIFEMVCNDLGFQIIRGKSNYCSLVIRGEKYKKLLAYFNMIDQSCEHFDLKNYENEIYQSVGFIFDCNSEKEGHVDTIKFSIEYDEEIEAVTLKHFYDSRLKSYIRFYMPKKTYNYYLKSLKERLNMFDFTIFDHGKDILIVTNDVESSRKCFNEYYSSGIKLIKRN